MPYYYNTMNDVIQGYLTVKNQVFKNPKRMLEVVRW